MKKTNPRLAIEAWWNKLSLNNKYIVTIQAINGKAINRQYFTSNNLSSLSNTEIDKIYQFHNQLTLF